MSRKFTWLLTLLCSGYLLVQVLYIAGLPLVMDEFANAGLIIRLAHGLPYRDFTSYKTVVGYYLLLPALVAFDSTWTAMLAAKAEIASVTTVILASAALRLRRHFSPPAILGGLLLLVTQSTFLERASELRVDMLSALLGLVSLVAYLDRRLLIAGTAAGCAVLVTQKGVYFALALGGAALFDAVRFRSRDRLRVAFGAGAAVAAVIGGYAAFWSFVGSSETVWRSMFLSPQRIAFVPFYSLGRFWAQTLERNPIFYGIGVAGLALLLPRWRRPDDTSGGRLWCYAVILTLLCIWHKQPWPYFFVMLIPTVWVVCIAVLDQITKTSRAWSFVAACLVVAGSLASLVERVPIVLARSSAVQRQVVQAAEAFLQPGETYFAGTELLWRNPHIAHLSWLDAPRLHALHSEPGTAFAELRTKPPRLVIENYRVSNLPQHFIDEIDQNFLDVGGNLFTYAPRLREGLGTTYYAHAGLYRVVAPPTGWVCVDGGESLAAGQLIRIESGVHRIEATEGARLASWSEAPAFIAQTGRPAKNLFASVYAY